MLTLVFSSPLNRGILRMLSLMYILFSMDLASALCPNDDYGGNYVEVIVGLGVPPPPSRFANNIQTAVDIANPGDTILIHPPFSAETVMYLIVLTDDSCDHRHTSLYSIFFLLGDSHHYCFHFRCTLDLIIVQNPDLTLPFGGCRVNCTAFSEGGFDGEPWSPSMNFTDFLIDQQVNVSKSVTLTSKCIVEGDDRDVLTTLSPLPPGSSVGCTPSETRCICEIITIESSDVAVTQLNVLGCDPLSAGYVPAPGIYIGIRNLTGNTLNVTTPSGIAQIVGHLNNISIVDVYFNGTLPAIIMGPVDITANTSAVSNLTISENNFFRTGAAFSMERTFCLRFNESDVNSESTCRFTLNNITELGDPPSIPAIGDLYSQSLGIFLDWQADIYAPVNVDPIDDNMVSGVCTVSCFILNASLYDLAQFRTVTASIIELPPPVSGSIVFALFLLLGVLFFIALLFFFLWYADRRSKEEQRKQEIHSNEETIRRTLQYGNTDIMMLYDTYPSTAHLRRRSTFSQRGVHHTPPFPS